MKKQLIFQYVLLFVALLLLTLGIVFKEHLDVFRKAITICLECIGIG